MGEVLDSDLCLEVKASLCRTDRRQAIFGDFRAFLFGKDFDLVRMTELGLCRGEALVEFNTFWVRYGAHGDPCTRVYKCVNAGGSAVGKCLGVLIAGRLASYFPRLSRNS